MASGFMADGDESPADQAVIAAVNSRLSEVPTSGIFTFFGLVYSPDQLREIIKDWNGLASGYERDLQKVDIIESVKPPGQDAPSGLFAEAVRGSGAALRRSLNEERAFCMRQAARFQAALDAYQGVEHNKKREFDQQGQGTVL